MLKLFFSFLIILVFHSNLCSQKITDDFSGKWQTEEGGTIEISRKEKGFIGVGALKKVVVLKNLQFNNGKWVSEMTNPKTNQSANCELTIDGNRIKIIAHKGIFSKTIYWTKL